MLIVDPWHWLEPDGELPANPRLRRQVVAVPRVVEYGNRVPPGGHCETLIECKRRPSRRACSGLLVVQREFDDTLLAYCAECAAHVMAVHNWRGTRNLNDSEAHVAMDNTHFSSEGMTRILYLPLGPAGRVRREKDRHVHVFRDLAVTRDRLREP